PGARPPGGPRPRRPHHVFPLPRAGRSPGPRARSRLGRAEGRRPPHDGHVRRGGPGAADRRRPPPGRPRLPRRRPRPRPPRRPLPPRRGRPRLRRRVPARAAGDPAARFDPVARPHAHPRDPHVLLQRLTAPVHRRILLDTSVLAPEPLWLWTLALTDGIPAAQRPHLLVTDGVARELRHPRRRVDPRLDRRRADRAARLRLDSLTRVASPVPDTAAEAVACPPPSPASRGARVLDPDDAFLDADALRLGVEALVSDDVHAFAP